MNIIEIEGKNLDDAKDLAVKELGIKDHNLLGYEVLDEGNKGILGLGSKKLKIKAWIKQDNSEFSEKTVRDILNILGLEAELKWETMNESRILSINGENLASLIGKHGRTLDSLQYILNIIVSKKLNERSNIILDVGGYKQRRERHLQDFAYKMAEKVKAERRNINHEPMIPSERRVIHMALKDHPYVETYSTGDEPMRKVTITPKNR